MANAAVRTGPEVNKNHGNWRPTSDIRETLSAKFPGLEFPYLATDHTHGVNSSVHCYCPGHETFTRIALAGALYDTTKYACSICANNAGMDLRKANGFSTKQYIGKPGVQSGIFRAVKAVFPDAVWEHRMKCGKEIDIWVPSIGAGIEYNGNYYHSTAARDDVKYHAMKSHLGQKEQKAIFHVFTEEAVEPYTNLVRLLEMCSGQHTYSENTRDEVRLCDAQIAQVFHREWGFVHPALTETICDMHVGLFRRGNLVAVVSGARSLGKVLRTTFRLYGVPLNLLLNTFQRIVGRKCVVWADYRNPLEVTAWCNCVKVLRYTGPIGFSLNKDFSFSYGGQITPCSEKIYDCGHLILTL